MTAFLEQVIRPFVTLTPFTPRLLPPTVPPAAPVGEEDVAFLQWGAESRGEINNSDNPVVGIKIVVEWNENKSKRKTQKVRVKNPDDENQFVDVERITSATFTNSLTGQEQKFNIAGISQDDGVSSVQG